MWRSYSYSFLFPKNRDLFYNSKIFLQIIFRKFFSVFRTFSFQKNPYIYAAN